MDQEPAVVVDENPQKCAFTAGDAREGHEWPDEHVADPALVGAFGFIATEGRRLATQCRAVETASAEVLADSAFWQIDAMPRFENRSDLSGGTGREFKSELAGFLQQLRVATHRAEVGTRWRTQS